MNYGSSYPPSSSLIEFTFISRYKYATAVSSVSGYGLELWKNAISSGDDNAYE